MQSAAGNCSIATVSKLSKLKNSRRHLSFPNLPRLSTPRLQFCQIPKQLKTKDWSSAQGFTGCKNRTKHLLTSTRSLRRLSMPNRKRTQRVRNPGANDSSLSDRLYPPHAGSHFTSCFTKHDFHFLWRERKHSKNSTNFCVILKEKRSDTEIQILPETSQRCQYSFQVVHLGVAKIAQSTNFLY